MINLTKKSDQQPQAQTQNPATEVVQTSKKTKTQGIFSITSRLTPKADFQFIGSSSQAEICSRDYLSWCKKGKAPKKMQVEYDKASKLSGVKGGEALDPSLIFKVEILEVCNTATELEMAKERYGIVRKAPTKLTTSETEPTNPLADTEVAKIFAELALAAELADKMARESTVAQTVADILGEEPVIEPIYEETEPAEPVIEPIYEETEPAEPARKGKGKKS